MILPLIVFVIGAVANITLAGLAVTRNPKSATHNLFALLGAALVLWSIAIFGSVQFSDPVMILWCIRASMAFAVLQATAFVMLVHTFPRARMKMSTRWRTFMVAITVLGMAVSFSPYVYPGLDIQPGRLGQPVPGWGMALFVPIAIGSLLIGSIMLFWKSWHAKGIERVQTRYLLSGVVITFGLLASLVLFMVNVQHDTRFVPYAPLFTLPLVNLTSYAIIRYRLMDIRLAIARSVSYSILVGAVLLIYGAFLVFAVPQISISFGISADIVAAGAALVSIPIARYIQQVLTRMTDRYFFQKRSDYQITLMRLGRRLSQTINIKTVTDTILVAIQEVTRTEHATIFLQEATGKEFIPRATTGKKNYRVAIPSDHILVQHLQHGRGLVIRDEIIDELEHDPSSRHRQELEKLYGVLQWTGSAVVVPLFIEKGLSGFILLSDKKSGQPYLKDDMDFLDALAPQAAIALENARLYQASLEFGEKLKEEVRRATSDLELANKQLRELDKAKSEFLSIASHQLYTPLTAIRGYLSMLNEGDFGTVPPEQKPVLDILIKSAGRLIDLIKNLLDISRIESGRLELNLEPIDLGEMAHELITDLMPNAHNKNLALEFEAPRTKIPPIIGDRQRLRQVLLNFVDNSIKYTDHGRIDVRVLHDKNSIIFEVSDTGKGLSRDEIAKLFTKFTRAGDAAHYHTEGTGLGLYVARKIVREHHGEVEAESSGKGQGSTFRMRLPVAGSARSLKVGDKVSVIIKAAEAGQGA